ncbi:PREDICTED: protein ABCI12, chloroplastic isoform X2 [Populus euphratica]|uniref:Protein ABCI12, chloroplastic isoform X2 n=1 Tax=Populus euphratica TaxID=75702 RepID=A0AAJ6TCZ0_POPEU|nr:PREDICTED: protein ABCI12, chloroplastic isoform X2 [Populus euphratica]
MNCTHCTIQTVTFPVLPARASSKTLISPFLAQVYPKSTFKNAHQTLKLTSFKVKASVDNSGDTNNWVSRLPIGALSGDKIFKLISGATASPIGQFISSPTTFLHSVDPRIKVDQLGRVSLLSGILFITLGLGSDGVPPLVQLRTPPPAITGLPNLPMSLSGYSYLIMKLGPLQFTRKGLSVASTAACLTFTVFQSASLCLATTTPEQLAFAMRWFMLPLRSIGVPVAEITLTLLLSLRFINLVFDEVRNVSLGIVSRRIKWKQLTIIEMIDIFASYIRRIFKNIFSHAEQISQAMIVRGFRGDSNSHKIYFFSDSSIGMADFVSLLCLIGVVGAALLSDYYLV